MPGRERATTWWVELVLGEDEGVSSAEARLRTRRPTPLTERGEARLSPRDKDDPLLGLEIAVARALMALADRLAACADADLGGAAHGSASVVVLEAEAPAPCPRVRDDAPAYGRYPS